MGQIVVITRFRTYTVAGGTVNVAPTALSAISRPLGGGATIENFGNILGNSVVGQTGLYFVELTDASYVDGTKYEVYCTATVSGSTVYGIQEFQFRALTADTTPPGPVTNLALVSRTATTITLSFTPPTDADFSTVEFVAEAKEGGTSVSTTDAASPVTITGQTVGQLYNIVATAKDTSGNRSTPVTISVRTKAASTAATNVIEFQWYTNRRSAQHSASPWQIDADEPANAGHLVTKHIQLHAGHVNELRVRGLAKGPIAHLEILEMGLVYRSPKTLPAGRSLE
jgi:hypothetical protein